MKSMKLEEATMLALRGKLNEVKGASKTYTCIEDRQGGDFAVGKTMTAEEWGEEAYSWAYGDDWTDPEEPLLKNFKTEKECLDFIQDMWEITIVPSDSPEAKEFLGEARSHKVKRSRKLEGIRAIEEHEYEFDDLYDIVGENGKSVLDDIRNANKEDEFMDYLIATMGEDEGKSPTVGELSDFIDYDYATIFRDLEMKTENKKKTEVKNDIMSFEDWVDFIDIKEDYPDWPKDKSELDRPFLDVINDHIDELNRDYRKYKRNQTKKEDIR